MLQSARRVFAAVTVPRLPVKALLAVTTLGSFIWLLAQDLVHPFAVYLLQLYLAF
jgi:hypothetical protein